MMLTRRTVTRLLTTAAVAVTASALRSLAMDGLEIHIQSTNVVISWPSAGYETFLIQSCPTLDAATPWSSLTTNYPANGNPRTTFTVEGVVSPPSSGSGGGTNGGAPPEPMATRADGTGAIVPLALYPPGFDLSGFLIYDPAISDWVKGPDYTRPTPFISTMDAPQPMGRTGGLDGSQGDGQPSSMFYRVFLVPDFWYDYSRYTFTYGSEFMPLYLGVDASMVTDVKLLVDGQDFPYQEFDLQRWNFGTPRNPDWQYTYGIWFHSDRLTNGTHTLRLVTTLQLDPTSLSDNTPYLTMTSPPFQTTVNNPIVFTQWDNLLVGTSHTFRAKTTTFPATWEIDVWDADGNWVTSATGTTSDGNISWTWDFYDDYGVLRDNVEVDPYFDPWITVTPSGGMAAQTAIASSSSPLLKGTPTSVTPKGLYATSPSLDRSSMLAARTATVTPGARPLGGSTPTERPAPLSSIDYPYNGGWIVAYQDIAKNNDDARNAFLQMFYGICGAPSQAGLSVGAILLKYGRTNEIDMTSDPVQNMINRNASWDNLRYHLLQPLCRNLYLFAHGSGFSVGGDWEKYGPSGQGLGSEYDKNTYQTANGPISTTAYLTSGWCQRLKKPVADNPHPYRFVFLDGCSTATGDWTYPFGIIPDTNSITYYSNDGERPNAFVGWAETISYAGTRNSMTADGFGDYNAFAYFRTEWAFNWAFNAQTHGLDAALGMAQNHSNWLPPGQMGRYIRIYGYNPLGFNDYNQRLFSFPPQ